MSSAQSLERAVSPSVSRRVLRAAGVGLLFAVIALLPLTTASAVDPNQAITQYVHESWDDDSGLPQNSVLALAQTPDGFLWIGTEDGLAFFDGVRFTRVARNRVPPCEPASLLCLWITK